jgi:hypothetical protein
MVGAQRQALTGTGRAGIEPIIAIASRALSQHGEGFAITTSYGARRAAGGCR